MKLTEAVWDKVLFWSYVALFFFVPLIFTPWNYELFEFNKMVLVYLLTTIIVWAWINKIIVRKKIIFRRTFWDIPLFLFLISQVISTLISIDRHTSIFGYYSRFHGGLLSTICYLLLYWAFVSNIKTDQKERLIKVILASGTLVTLYGIAEHFGIDKKYWVQDVQNRVFSTLGQPNWLAAYLDVLIFILLVKIVSSSSPPIFYLLYSIFYLCLLYTKSRSGFLGFILPFFIFLTNWIVHSIRKKKAPLNKKLSVIIIITLTVSLLAGIPFQLKGLRSKINFSFLGDVQELPAPNLDQAQPASSSVRPKITPSSDIRKIVWKGAIKLWRRYPLFGTGVETFAYAYYWTRPKEHNLTSEWDFLYNKAHNEFLNFAATTGTFGLLTYLLLIGSVLVFSFQKTQSQEARIIVPLTFISLSITNFFGFSVVPIAIFFFLLPALYLVPKKIAEVQVRPQTKDLASGQSMIKLLITTSVALWIIYRIICYWLADYHFAQGRKLEKAGYFYVAIDHLNKAINLNRSEPNFYAQRGVTLAKLVAALAQSDQIQNQSQQVNQFIEQAISDCQKSLQISPFHISFYKNQARMYYYLSFVKLDYLRGALEALSAAEKLAPTDPKIPYNIGLIYQTFDDQDRAKKYLQKALELKPDYQAAQNALKQLE